MAIVILLGIVYHSYRQTIAAYPNGGGSYTVAREKLGAKASLLGAAALMTDYVLNVAVGISGRRRRVDLGPYQPFSHTRSRYASSF